MSDSKQAANDAGKPGGKARASADAASACPAAPGFPSLARGEGEEIDPGIAALLDFEPVPRKREVDGAWTPELQREFISRLAVTGSIGRAAEEMGKTDSGVRKLYRSPGGASFRAAWEAAIELAKRRLAEAFPADERVAPGSRPPGLDARRKQFPGDPHAGPLAQAGEGDMSEEEKWELIEQLGRKFMRKVAQEREARLSGNIVAADFYLRQITTIEVLFDLSASGFGFDAAEALLDLRRGGRDPLQIVSTPFADWLDRSRRKYWLGNGDPERPEHPDPRYTRDEHQGPWGSRATLGYSIALPVSETGADTPPAEGYTQAEWAKLTMDEQVAARRRDAARNAQEQRAWEECAIADHLARQSAPLPGEGEGGARASAREGEGCGEGDRK